MPAIDSALLIIDNCRGVETQTKAVIRLARKYNLPLMAFWNCSKFLVIDFRFRPEGNYG